MIGSKVELDDHTIGSASLVVSKDRCAQPGLYH